VILDESAGSRLNEMTMDAGVELVLLGSDIQLAGIRELPGGRMIKHSRLLPPCVLGLALAAVGCGGDDPASGSDPDATHDGDTLEPRLALDFEPWDTFMESYLDEHGLGGAVSVVVHREHGIVHEVGYGAFDTDRVFLIASSGKLLSAGVLMRLADEGLLDIDAPLGTFLDWEGNKEDITVAQLLSNSSGMPGLVETLFFEPYGCALGADASLLGCGQALYAADDAEMRTLPDTEFRYGGPQWQLVGSVAEAVSGKSWAELVHDTYVEPCGADTLGYTNHHRAWFYEVNEDLAAAMEYPTFMQGSSDVLSPTNNPHIEAGAYISGRDMGTVLLMHLRGGLCGDARALSQESVDRMQHDRVGEVYGGESTRPGEGYGFGWFVSRDEPGSVAHNGMYGSVQWLDNSRGYAVIVLVEAGYGFDADRQLRMKPVMDAVFDAAG
jgi:CubicO group peptidase (beta-lactamase class C family)